MFRKLLCGILVVAFSIQIIDASIPALIIAQYIPKIAALKVEIFLTAKNGSNSIKDTVKKIDAIADAAKESLSREIRRLEKHIDEVQIEAENSHTNITSCILEEILEVQQFNLDTMDQCKTPDEVKHLQMYAMKLMKEAVAVSIATKLCIIKHPFSGENLKQCYDETIHGARDKINEFRRLLDSDLHQAQENSLTCVEENLGTLQSNITTISDNFDHCIENTSRTTPIINKEKIGVDGRNRMLLIH